MNALNKRVSMLYIYNDMGRDEEGHNVPKLNRPNPV